MVRIFCGLAVIALLLLVTNTVIGFMTGDYGGLSIEYLQKQERLREMRDLTGDRATREQEAADLQGDLAHLEELKSVLTIHMLIGVLASLITVLVSSICVTYFVGTSRWCREVTEAYDLDMNFVQRSYALKRKTFPWSVFSMLLIVGVVALGSLSDPYISGENSVSWRTVHYILALTCVFVVGTAFYVQLSSIAANFGVINEILDEVRRVREERGLDIENVEDAPPDNMAANDSSDESHSID